MGETCSKHEGHENIIQHFCRGPEGKRLLGSVGVYGRIILKCILMKYGRRMDSSCSWYLVNTTINFRIPLKKLRNSWSTDRLPASQITPFFNLKMCLSTLKGSKVFLNLYTIQRCVHVRNFPWYKVTQPDTCHT